MRLTHTVSSFLAWWLSPRLASKLVKSQRKGNRDYSGVLNWQEFIAMLPAGSVVVRELVLVASTKRGDRTAGPLTPSQLRISSTLLTQLVLVSLGCDLEFASAEALG